LKPVTPPNPETTDADGAPAARLQRQISFLLELDRLKNVLRRSYLLADERRENAAEHSWHLGMAVLVLAEYAVPVIDRERVLQMALLHDVVEIDAGDTYSYDAAAMAAKPARERQAAQRIFALLPPDQEPAFRALWEEFEAGITPEARFADAVDRLLPLLHNYHTQGRSWREHGIDQAQVLARCTVLQSAAPRLWALITELVQDAVAQGYLRP